MDFKKQTYSNQVAHHIRETIRNGFLVQGDPVKEVLLAETLGISRAPVREALQTLIQEGLITSEPQKGKQVRKLTAKEIHDSYIVGGILEGAGVADSLSEWTAADMKKLTELLNIMERQSRHATSLDELVDIDEAFHGTLLMHCDNTQLVEMARSSCATISKYLCYRHWISMFTPQEFYRRHSVIAEAVYSRDATHVEQTLRAHYKESGARMAQFVF